MRVFSLLGGLLVLSMFDGVRVLDTCLLIAFEGYFDFCCCCCSCCCSCCLLRDGVSILDTCLLIAFEGYFDFCCCCCSCCCCCCLLLDGVSILDTCLLFDFDGCFNFCCCCSYCCCFCCCCWRHRLHGTPNFLPEHFEWHGRKDVGHVLVGGISTHCTHHTLVTHVPQSIVWELMFRRVLFGNSCSAEYCLGTHVPQSIVWKLFLPLSLSFSLTRQNLVDYGSVFM